MLRRRTITIVATVAAAFPATVAALAAASPATAQAQGAVVELGGVIAAEQSLSPGVAEDGVALVRPDGSFIGPEDSWGLGGHPDFSPDGRALATSFEGCVWFTPILERQFPANCRFRTGLRLSEPTWAPDGRHLAAVGQTGTGSERRWDIYVFDPDATGVRQVTDNGLFKSDPKWRVDGTIAYVEHPPGGDPSDVFSIRWDAPTGSRPQRETTGSDIRYIAFQDLSYGIGSSAYITSSNTSAVPDRLYVEGIEVLESPTWSLRGVAWQPGVTPNFLVVAVNRRLVIFDRAGNVVRRLPVEGAQEPAWGVDAFAAAGAAGPGGGAIPPATDPQLPPANDPQRPPATGVREERPAPRPAVPDGLGAADTSVRAGRLALTLGCPDPVDCRITVAGRASAAPAVPRRATAARLQAVRLRTARYRLAAGTSRRVRYRLPRRALRLLRAGGPLRVSLEVTVAGASTRSLVRSLTVRPAPSRSRTRPAR